jgi:outer membrane protein assembly factor BamB
LETQILGPDGSVDRTLDGQVLVPSCGDGQLQGWLVARSEGLVRLDGDGRQLWSVGEYPDVALCALAQGVVVSAGDGVWSVDPETGERGWQWDLAEVTTGWDAARGGSSPTLEWYGPWSAFTDGQVVMLVVSGDMPVTESDAESGSITVESRSGLVALDAATGKVRWEVAPDAVDQMFVAVDGHLLGVRTPRWTAAESTGARGEVSFFG